MNRNVKHDESVRVSIQVQKDLHRTFKTWCIQNDLTLQAGVERAVDEMLRAEGARRLVDKRFGEEP